MAHANNKCKADKASRNLKPRVTNSGTSNSGQASWSASGNSSAAKVTEGVMWIAQEVCAAAGKSTLSIESSWIFDSGRSRHLTGSCALFISGSYVKYTPREHQIPVAGNGVRGEAGYKDVMVNIHNPGGNGVRAVTVHSVLHVPGCGDNTLVSMGQLEDLGIGFENGMRKGVYCYGPQALYTCPTNTYHTSLNQLPYIPHLVHVPLFMSPRLTLIT